MRALFLTVVALSTAARTNAQPLTLADVALKRPVSIAGIVVDPDGKPAANIRFDHAIQLPRHRAVTTDADGQFAFSTVAPLVILRDPRYLSKVIRTEEFPASGVMQLIAAPKRSLRRCKEGQPLDARYRLFRLPRAKGVVRAAIPESDVDYNANVTS